jgi:endonuclease III
MAIASAPKSKSTALKVAKLLAAEYPDAECALKYSNPLELLVATILSAQCTDVRVNLVTPQLFRKYRTAAAFAAAKREQLEKEIQTTGFFRSKAKSIQQCCRALEEKHGGEVPKNLDELVQLAGVGRKTANVVLGTAFGIPSGVVVDTHVGRITHRLGLTKHEDAVKIERDLMAQLPSKEWIDFSHRLIHHGRKVCIARKPRCTDCVLQAICPKIGVSEKSSKPKVSGRSRSRLAKLLPDS